MLVNGGAGRVPPAGILASLAAIGSRGGDSGEGKKSSLRASQAPRPTSRHSGRRHEPLLANYGGYRRTRLHPERDRYREQEEGLDRRGRRLRTASCFGSSHASRKTLHFTHIPAPPCPHGAIMRTKEERRQSWPARITPRPHGSANGCTILVSRLGEICS